MLKKEQNETLYVDRNQEMSANDIQQAKAKAGSVGMASVLIAVPLSLVLTVLVIWNQDLALLWGLLIYPVLGAALIFGISLLLMVLIETKLVIGFRERFMPRVSQAPLRSHEQTPPR